MTGDRSTESAGVATASAAAFVRDRLTWLSYLMVGYYSYLLSSMGPLMPALRAELGIGYTVASLHLSMLAGGSVTVGLLGERQPVVL